jgi:hypothetical protein
MSDDRLEKALEAMKSENISPEDLAGARARVWEKLEKPASVLCSEFQTQFRDYLDGKLSPNRRLLVEDHLSRCPMCRAQLAAQKGESKVVPLRDKSRAWWPKWGSWAAAAALLLVLVYAGRNSIDVWLAPHGPRATVAYLSGNLYLVSGGTLKMGSAVNENVVVRTGPGARAKLHLSDGSLVSLNERTELFINAAWSGETVHLQGGDVIVEAAKQHRSHHLRVQTRDTLASVKGTIFAVSSGFIGTVVSVVEGSVAVTQPGVEVLLRPGQQAASNPALVDSVQNAVSWSPDAQTYLEILASLSHVEKQMAVLPSRLLRTESRLLPYVPANTILYGAIPNLTGTLNQAIFLLEQQASENPAFNRWWTSGAQGLKQLIGKMQTFMPLLGDEIVYTVSLDASASRNSIPMILAEIRSGKQSELAAAIDELRTQISPAPLYYALSETHLTISDSQSDLQWLADQTGKGSATPFAAEIAARYQDGAGWLLGLDMETITSLSTRRDPFVGAQQVKYIFLDQRTVQGAEENEMAVTFAGPRTGLASILASTGSGGAAEYISSDAVAAAYVSTREPQQLFEELTAQFSRSVPSFPADLAKAEARLGINLKDDLVRAFGTESAFGLEGLTTSGPVWAMAALVNDSAVLESTIGRLVEFSNAELAKTGHTGQITMEREVIDGRPWITMKFPAPAATITWAYDRGYMVAGSDRGAALRALATRNGGSPLIYSQAFQPQLSSLAGPHPSGFAWLNAKAAFQGWATVTPNPLIQKLIAERDPILVIFSGSTEQIRAVSRTRLSGMFMNLLLLQGQSRAASTAVKP